MRPLMIPAALISLVLAAAPAALAAPTCQDRGGATMRCGTPGAMPVGWRVAPGDLWDRRFNQADDLTLIDGVRLVGLIGALFALIALMPDFDGSEGDDWDRQEGDEDHRPRRRRPGP